MSIPGDEQTIAGIRLGPATGLTRRIRRIHRVFRTLAEGSTNLPVLLGKPPLLKLWLLTARKAQIAAAVSVLLLTVIAPPVVGEAADRLYPPIVSETKLLGVLDRSKVYPNPLREVRYTQVMTALWIVAITLIVALLIEHIPAAARIGRNRACRLMSEAERIAPNEPDKSARLRQSAESLLLESPGTIDSDPISARSEDTDVDKTVLIDPMSRPAARFVGPEQRYRLDKVLGSGGMGVVHAGFDNLLDRPVAIKQLFGHLIQDAGQTQRFRQEALALARLSHPHIVAVHDLLEDSGELWIVMEMLSGGTLADRITGITPTGVEEAVEIACKVAAGLGLAHQNGILHRDVKPMNILFTADDVPKITDFGNAKLTESAIHTREGEMIGSPSFMSPEQITGKPIDHRTDVYSLGVTLYQMLTGKVPFEGEISSILAQHVTQTPEAPGCLNPNLPKALDSVLLAMLGKAPEDRYQDMDAVISALQAVELKSPLMTAEL